jgi:hypothetical protein
MIFLEFGGRRRETGQVLGVPVLDKENQPPVVIK